MGFIMHVDLGIEKESETTARLSEKGHCDHLAISPMGTGSRTVACVPPVRALCTK